MDRLDRGLAAVASRLAELVLRALLVRVHADHVATASEQLLVGLLELFGEIVYLFGGVLRVLGKRSGRLVNGFEMRRFDSGYQDYFGFIFAK